MLGLAVRRNFREKEVYFFSNSRFKTQFMTPSKHSYSQLPTHTATSDGYLRGHAYVNLLTEVNKSKCSEAFRTV